MGPLPRTHGLLGAMLESEELAAHAGHHGRPALPRLVAAHAPAHALVPRRADRLARRHHRRLLPHRQGGRGRVQRRGPAPDRDARRARRARDRERAAVRAQPRAERDRGAQPAGPRPARLGRPEAVRHRAGRALGGRAARARPGGGPRAGRPARRARPGGGRGAALARLPAAPGRASRRTGSARRCASTSRCCGASTGARSSSSSPAAPASRPSAAAEVFRIAQEALDNALRHSGAAHIAVRLSEPNGRLLLTVEDDGVGFEPESAALRSRRLGLTSMEERAGALGGSLSVESRPGAGATIGLEVPLGDDSRPDRG